MEIFLLKIEMVGYLSKSTYIFAIGISDNEIVQKIKNLLKENIKKAIEEETENT